MTNPTELTLDEAVKIVAEWMKWKEEGSAYCIYPAMFYAASGPLPLCEAVRIMTTDGNSVMAVLEKCDAEGWMAKPYPPMRFGYDMHRCIVRVVEKGDSVLQHSRSAQAPTRGEAVILAVAKAVLAVKEGEG